MVDRLNPFHEAALEVAQEIASMKRDNRSRGPKITPFGMERLGAAQMRKRLREDQGLRRKILEQGPNGRAFILDLFRQAKEGS